MPARLVMHARHTPEAPRRVSRMVIDRRKTAVHSFPMNHTDSSLLELRHLEARVEDLVATIQQLREENRALRHGHESLASERAALLNRNEQARTRVEAMIGRLKTLEHGA